MAQLFGFRAADEQQSLFSVKNAQRKFPLFTTLEQDTLFSFIHKELGGLFCCVFFKVRAN